MTSLRFVLDQDVDAACVGVLTSLGHRAWTVGDAGRATASDSEQLIYAQDENAVLVTHDRRFATSQRNHPIGRLIRLKCSEWDAPRLLEMLVPKAVPLLAHTPNLLIVASIRSDGSLNMNNTFGTEPD